MPQPHREFPGKSFSLEEKARKFSEPQKSHHTPSCSGQEPPLGGQHGYGWPQQFVKCLKWDVLAQSCHPPADPCYHQLSAGHWPPCPHPAGVSPADTSQTVKGFRRQPVLKPLGPPKQPRGSRRGQGPAFLEYPGSAIWHSRRAHGCFGASQICFVTWPLPLSQLGTWARNLDLFIYKTT